MKGLKNIFSCIYEEMINLIFTIFPNRISVKLDPNWTPEKEYEIFKNK